MKCKLETKKTKKKLKSCIICIILSLSLKCLKLYIKIKMKIKLNFDIRTFLDKLAGERKLKLYDECESLAINSFVLTSNLHDTFDGKTNCKRQFIQILVIIAMLIVPFIWFSGFIYSQTQSQRTFIYLTYFGSEFGQDKLSGTVVLVFFIGIYYHFLSNY